jgi:hypothetical protein
MSGKRHLDKKVPERQELFLSRRIIPADKERA